MAGEHDHIGGFAVPSDIDGYAAVTATYRSGVLPNQLGTQIPVSPTAVEPAAIEATETSWVVAAGTQPTIPPGSQAKMRLTLSGASHILADDPIRNFGHPGASHMHMFYGNRGTNAFSTFPSLRTRNSSGSAGGPMNGTAYWVPAILVDNAFGNGLNYAVRSESHIVYYNDNDVLNTHLLTLLRRGLRYIMGQNMDDPLQAFLTAEIAAANAQPGTAGRYSFPSGYSNKPCPGFDGWKMLNPANGLIQTGASADQPNADYSYGFTNADGSDPWEGAGDPALHGGLSCKLVAVLSAPHYWDGANLWSPGGYNHFRYGIYDSVAGKNVGPHGWFKVPGLEQQIIYRHRGWADYQRWYLSSDAHYESLYGSPIVPGYSMHGDWLGAWQDRVFQSWQTHCNGVGNNNPHECNTSAFADGEGLAFTGQVIDWTGDTSTAAGMFLLPASGVAKGPITIRTRHT